MKKVVLCIAILSLLTLNFIGCKSNNNVKQTQASNVKQTQTSNITQTQTNNTKKTQTHNALAVAVKKSGICNVSIEPKIELLGVVQYLANDPTIVKENGSEECQKYSDDISQYFSKYADEPVVMLYKKMMDTGFSYSTAPEAMLYVDNNLKLLNKLTLPRNIVYSAGGKDTLIKFYNLLSDFRSKSNFDEFYVEHINFYNKLVTDSMSRVNKTKCIETLINYYGYKQNSYNFVIKPLASGGFGVRTPSKNGKFDLYDFMVSPKNDLSFFALVVHEFGHSYVNPLTEQNINEVNKYSNLFVPIEESMTNQHYPIWESCVNEHIIQAVVYRNIHNIYGSEKSQNFLRLENESKFIYMYDISEKLKEYENNRDKYPTFKDFYPKLLDLFKELSEKEASKQ